MAEIVEQKNDLKTKVSQMGGDFLYKNTQIKALAIHVERLEERSRKLDAENESVLVTKRLIIAYPMNSYRQKHSSKATKMIAESLEE